MSEFGMTPQGFALKRLSDILSDIEAGQRAEDVLGPDIVQTGDSVLGALNAIFAAATAETWEALADLDAAFDPDKATGVHLDALCSLTGVQRLAATRSTVTLKVTGDEGTTIAQGSEVAHETTGDRFRTTEEVTIGASGTAEVEAEALEKGPIQASPESLTDIQNPAPGWDTVTNDEAALVGRDRETDVELRLRREELLRARGAASLDAIRENLLDLVDGVQQVRVFENTGLETDADGIPGKAVEVVVLEQGADADDIRLVIFETKAGGIEAHGTEPGTVTDDEGLPHTVAFSRATTKDIHVEVELTKDADYPSDGDAQVRDAIVAKQGGIGEEVIWSRFYKAVFSVPGVVDVQKLEIGVDGIDGTENIPVGAREVGQIRPQDVQVDSTDA